MIELEWSAGVPNEHGAAQSTLSGVADQRETDGA